MSSHEFDTTPQRDLYAYDGSGADTGTGTTIRTSDSNRKVNSDTSEQGSECDERIQKWHPDYSLSSPQARKWYQDYKKSLNEPLDLNDDGTYTVKRGDCLSSVAARELVREGMEIDKQTITDEVKHLIELNKDKFKSLDCNKEYLDVGWNIKVNDNE